MTTPRRCVSRRRTAGRRFLRTEHRASVRSRADLRRLPSRRAGRHARRTLDRRTALRRTRTWTPKSSACARRSPEITFLGMMIGSGKELLHFFNVMRSPVSAFYVGKLFLKFLRDMAFHGRPMRLMNGNALVARLAKSCFDKNVPIWTRSPVRELDEGRDRPSHRRDRRHGARAGQGRRAQGRRACRRRLPAGPRAPQGAVPARAVAATSTPRPPRPAIPAMACGSAKRSAPRSTRSCRNAAAWVPISRPVCADGTLGTFPHFVDRSKPGIIAVTRSGRRFVNEANSYHDFCQAMYRALP